MNLPYQQIMADAIEHVQSSDTPVDNDAQLYRLTAATLAHDVEQLRLKLERAEEEIEQLRGGWRE